MNNDLTITECTNGNFQAVLNGRDIGYYGSREDAILGALSKDAAWEVYYFPKGAQVGYNLLNEA